MPRGGKSTLIITQSIETPDIKAGVFECPTLTCCHCNRQVILHPQRVRPRGLCLKCNAYRCDSPGCASECNPFMESVELAIRHDGLAEPFLLRGPNGEVLFNTALRDAARIH